MPTENVMTQDSYNKLKRERDELISQRPEIAERLKEARAFGDLSENAEYDAAKEEQAKLEAEIEQLDYQIRNARIVTEEELNAGKVNLGLTVTIKDLKTKEVFDYKIVGITESDPLEGLISNESPVGSALMGKQKGDKIEVVIDSKDATEGTVLHYQILDIKKQ